MQVLNRFIKLYLLLFVMFLMGTSVKADEITKKADELMEKALIKADVTYDKVKVYLK